MSESQITVGEWLGAAVTIILSALGGTIAGAKYGRTQLTERIEEVEVKINNHIFASTAKHADHTTQIAVIQTCQENTRDGLVRIEATTKDTNNKLDMLIQSLLDRQG